MYTFIEKIFSIKSIQSSLFVFYYFISIKLNSFECHSMLNSLFIGFNEIFFVFQKNLFTFQCATKMRVIKQASLFHKLFIFFFLCTYFFSLILREVNYYWKLKSFVFFFILMFLHNISISSVT